MILIFDLDDTLYAERNFIESGYNAVAESLSKSFGWNKKEILKYMFKLLNNQGRENIFNILLEKKGKKSKKLINKCLLIYRNHKPSIKLPQSTKNVLSGLSKKPYLVTDGHKIVQKNKIHSLKIKKKFQKIFITHQYGIKYAKPSTYCFKKIKKIENCKWNQMAYIGDNPAKDFINLNILGIKTIRVLTGEHSKVKVKKGFNANYSISSLEELPSLIKKVFK